MFLRLNEYYDNVYWHVFSELNSGDDFLHFISDTHLFYLILKLLLVFSSITHVCKQYRLHGFAFQSRSTYCVKTRTYTINFRFVFYRLIFIQKYVFIFFFKFLLFCISFLEFTINFLEKNMFFRITCNLYRIFAFCY